MSATGEIPPLGVLSGGVGCSLTNCRKEVGIDFRGRVGVALPAVCGRVAGLGGVPVASVAGARGGVPPGGFFTDRRDRGRTVPTDVEGRTSAGPGDRAS